MHILLASYWKYPGFGGISTYMCALKHSLEQRGHAVNILSKHPVTGTLGIQNQGEGIPLSTQPYELRKIPIKEEDTRIIGQEKGIHRYQEACRLLRLHDYDLIHSQDIFSATALAAVVPEIPLVLTVHGLWPAKMVELRQRPVSIPPLWEYARWLYRHAISLARQTILVCGYQKGALAEMGIASAAFSVVPNGIPIAQLLQRSQERPRPKLPPRVQYDLRLRDRGNKGVPIIACVARLSPIKGHPVLFQAIKTLAKQGLYCKCWVIGGGATERQLKRVAWQQGVARFVHFFGKRSDVPVLLRLADVAVLPSLLEMFPFAALEAQALGKPLVASAVGGLPEIVQDGITGLLVPPSSPEDLALSLRTVLPNKDLQERLGNNAAAWARQHWDVTRMTDQTEAIYVKALQGRD